MSPWTPWHTVLLIICPVGLVMAYWLRGLRPGGVGSWQDKSFRSLRLSLIIGGALGII
jgi:hypothetical protein